MPQISKEEKIAKVRVASKIFKINLEKLSDRSISLLIDAITTINDLGSDADQKDMEAILKTQIEMDKTIGK